MQRMSRRISLLSVGCVVALWSGSPASAATLESMAWLAGCWANENGDAGSGEFWLPPAGGRMLGIGRVVRDGRTVEYEFLELEATVDGELIYTATPSRQARAAFKATLQDRSSVTFENAAHDFPQRITYTRVEPGRMVVRVDGDHQGKRRLFEYRFARSACTT